MTNDEVTELLKNYRSYEYASMNCGDPSEDILPTMISERMRRPETWDKVRYKRIVIMVRGAVDHVLSDEQQIVIRRKYMERNTMNLGEIAYITHKDRSTVSRWHKEAINRLAVALMPLKENETEITNFDHIFDKDWVYQEPA